MHVHEYSNLQHGREGRRGGGSAERTNPPAVDVLLWILWVLIWSILASVLLVGLAILIGIVVLPALGAGVPLVVILLLVLLVGLLGALRRRRSGTVMAYLEQAMRLNLPLPAMLRAAERSERWMTAVALRRVRLELEGGLSVRDAVAAGLPGTSPRTLGLIGSAERSGRLPFALDRLARDAAYRFDGRPGAELYLRWYPATLALVTASIVSVISIFVMPKFVEIFQDFTIELPWITVTMLRVWEVLAIPVCVIVALATLLYVGRMLATILAPRLVPRGPVRWAIDVLKWYTPVVAGITRWRALADASHVMADALEAGRPLDYAVTEASRSGTNVVLAERLAAWADQTRAGQPPVEGAARARMPAMLVGLMRTSAGAELPDVLRFLARYYDSRFARSSVMLGAMLVPALSLTAGVIVGTIVLSLFIPLVRMMDHMSELVWNF